MHPASAFGEFEALASPVRLSILRSLRTPRTLGGISVKGERADSGAVLARQTVRRHLDALLDAGLVRRLDVAGEEQYVIDHLRLFSLAEGVRDLARLRPAVEPDAATQAVGAALAATEQGPRLVLLRGLDEGATFLLGNAVEVWRIGRRRGLEVSLDYDAAVSSLNALIRLAGRGHELEDAEGSRNGTFHNFTRLAPGAKVLLRHGDVIGVGRSLLLYWT